METQKKPTPQVTFTLVLAFEDNALPDDNDLAGLVEQAKEFAEVTMAELSIPHPVKRSYI